MTAYYNENDPKAAAWLRELISRGLIASGVVDDRSITEVQPEDLRDFNQCHFFAGIGVWSYALRSAEWADDRAVWTGSCPCQPFSSAGKGEGVADARHLWPEWARLIRECRPDVIFGEQVASKAALAWFDVVSADLESASYAIGAADLCAAGVGAPHIRQRLYWVADAASVGHDRRRSSQESDEPGSVKRFERLRASSVVGNSSNTRLSQQLSQRSAPPIANEPIARETTERASTPVSFIKLEHPNSPRIHAPIQRRESGWVIQDCAETRRTGATRGRWGAADWVVCRDDKLRPVEPGSFPLAHGAPARVVRLRGYGNAIVAQQAQAFIEAYREVTEGSL